LIFSMPGYGLFFKNLPKGRISVLQKRAAHTECVLWVWEVFPTSRAYEDEQRELKAEAEVLRQKSRHRNNRTRILNYSFRRSESTRI
jgi:hypothetical protein